MAELVGRSVVGAAVVVVTGATAEWLAGVGRSRWCSGSSGDCSFFERIHEAMDSSVAVVLWFVGRLLPAAR